VHTPERSVLSLYLRVPANPAEFRELSARTHGLMRLAVSSGGGSEGSAGELSANEGFPAAGGLSAKAAGQPNGFAERASARPDGVRWPADSERQVDAILEAHARDWLGHTAAIFVEARAEAQAADAGLPTAFALPCALPDRAVLAERPHVRPLLVAEQRCPAHIVAVVDRQHAWLFRVVGDQIEIAGAAQSDPAEQVRDSRFGGWYGLDSYGVSRRVSELTHQHFQAAAALTQAVMGTGPDPLVIGGHEETIGQFAALLSAGLRERLAGSFVIDPHAMTPARVRELAGPVIGRWVGMHEQSRSMELREGEGRHDPLTVTGLARCLDAVNSRAVDLLVVPVGGVIDGYVCERCGALGAAVTGCPDGPAESRWVPDLFEEMVARTIEDGGRTEALADPPGDVAAHLRFPVVNAS